MIELTAGFDQPDRVADQLAWLAQAGFTPHTSWSRGDLAVLVGERASA